MPPSYNPWLPKYRGKPYQRVLVVIGSFALAGALGWGAQSAVPAQWKDLAMFCGVWCGLYPIPCINRRIPWWWHWMQGVVVLIGFLAAMRWLGHH